MKTGKMIAAAMAGLMVMGTLAAPTAALADDYTISVIVKLTDGHFNKVMAGARAYADEHDNVTVDIQSPTSATAYDEQQNMIETTLGQDSYDAVIISPLQSMTASVLVSGSEKTILALDTDFDAPEKKAFVGTGNKGVAKNGGKEAAELAVASGIEKPTAVILTGVQGDETHDARLEGYTEGFEEGGGEVLEVQYCDALADKAANAMESIIGKYPDGVDCVLSTNDDMVMAAVKVISDSTNENFKDCILCGFDGNQTAIEAIKDGSLAMDVAQLGFDMGYKAVEAAVKSLEGEEIDSFIDSGALIVTAENVDDYIEDMKAKGLWEG